MGEYKYLNSQYLVGAIVPLVNCTLLALSYYFNWGWIVGIILIIGVIFAIETAYYRITITSEGITEHKLCKLKKIIWSDIERISIHPNSKDSKYLVYLFTLKTELCIPYFIKDSKAMIKHIISQCKDSKDIFIEPKLLEYVKQ